MKKRLSDLDPEDRELLHSWMYADMMGVVNNDTRTFSPEFYELLSKRMPQLDKKLEPRDRLEIVIMEFLKLWNRQVPNTESVKALSLAAGLANKTLKEKLAQGIPIEDIIFQQDMDDGINE
jgi:hypothetical protein